MGAFLLGCSEWSGCLNRRKNCRGSVARSLGLGKAFQELQRSVTFQMSPERMESQ